MIYTHSISVSNGGGQYPQSVATPGLKPFADLTEAYDYAKEKGGYVVKLVEVTIEEVK